MQDRDIVTGKKYEPDIDVASTAQCTMLGPSIYLTNTFYEAASAVQKPTYAWVVDSKAELGRALTFALQAVISNTPLTILRDLKSWQSDSC